jgi:hypothetical protein
VDKQFWQAIIDSDYAVPTGHDVNELTNELLGYFASTDPILRDEFAYMILANWMENKSFGVDSLRLMIPKMIANLQVGIGEQATDTVFLRSFSALHLATLIAQDNETPYLSADEVKSVLEAALAYILAEKDLRGYIGEKGWAHSCAHTADVFKFLSRNPHLDGQDLTRILEAISTKLMVVGPYIYSHAEDDRLAHVLDSILKRNLVSLETLTAWIENLGEPAKKQLRSPENGMDGYAAAQNVRNFLRALYFQVALAENPRPLATELLPVLQKSITPYGWYKFD